jgi:glycosyltransferase involved in cell wall biosynthesis
MTPAKPRLAVISTFDDLCGIAGYTKPIVKLLEEHFDVTVFDLDQFIFKSKSPAVQRMAENELTSFCKTLAGFDAVNLQLEHGTLGNTAKSILRRLKLIVRHSRNITITFHTMIVNPPWPELAFVKDCLMLRPAKGLAKYRGGRHDRALSGDFYAFLRREQSRRRISLIVHTRRDARTLKLLYGLKNVHDHPLASLPQPAARQILAEASRDRFPVLRDLPADAVVLGCFGFLSRYKGFDTAIKALHLLPENFHLAIFGGTHPNSLVEQASVDRYVKRLLKLINPQLTMLDASGKKGTSLVLSGHDIKELSGMRHPTNLTNRVHFMGSLADADFPVAMAACDTILLPYLEVGQSSSGPLNWAICLGKHVVASRNRTFAQALRYYPGRFRTFDVGNYIELAGVLAAESKHTDLTEQRHPFPANYTTETNIDLYVRVMMADAPAADRAARSVTESARPARRAAEAEPADVAGR